MRINAFVLSLALACRVLTAATPQTQVTVTVKDKYDKPVDNAEVIMDFLGSHQVTKLGKRKNTHWEVRTNQTGSARFPLVPQGTLQIQVVAKNFQTYGNKIDVDEEKKTVAVRLNPPQRQYSADDPTYSATPATPAPPK